MRLLDGMPVTSSYSASTGLTLYQFQQDPHQKLLMSDKQCSFHF